ncbi:alpha/beta hydrolase-fold protein [Sporichthya polymorpha]|uniref:alpha/beta hydrolase-fold protein n=1 Tax=Sporichthya polymorpha TaxID=35751 RepID=UPI000369D19B|nr:alpha/beta hydrolase-fold protein [Sporichthya polymorpha]
MLGWGLAVAAGAAGCGNDPAPGAAPEPALEIPGGYLETGSFLSEAMGAADVRYAISYPPGFEPGAQLPVVLELFGRGGNELIPFSRENLALGRIQAMVIKRGMPPFAVATVNGGPTSYWHRRASGIDPQAMILDEYLPLLASKGLLVDRIALMGESMGGYGSLLLAQRLGAERVAAVAVYAPAIYRTSGVTVPGAFDGPEDFAAHDVMSGAALLRGIPMRIVCGTLDPFYGMTQTFARLPHEPPVQATYAEEGHSAAYWRRETPAQLRFLAERLVPATRAAATSDPVRS